MSELLDVDPVRCGRLDMRGQMVLQAARVKSRDIRRAEAMGFTFGPVAVEADAMGFGYYVIDGTFTCICGRTEFYKFRVAEFLVGDRSSWAHVCDIGALLRSHGSFSRKHLLADGYSEEQVDEIIARGEAFDQQEALA